MEEKKIVAFFIYVSRNDFGVRWTQQNMKGQRSSSLEFENEVRRTDDFLREWKNQKETKSGIKIV